VTIRISGAGVPADTCVPERAAPLHMPSGGSRRTVVAMGIRDGPAEVPQPSPRSAVLAAIPVALVVVITLADLQSPNYVHLGPLLVIAPALTASFAGPRLTALVGALAIAGQVLIAVLHGGISTTNHIAQIIGITVLSAMVVVFTVVREHRRRQLVRAQSVADAAQRALLRPLPDRIGSLRISTAYVAAEEETLIGGDLYTATRLDDGTRMIIGDVRGKGLAAICESALLLSAFRLIARQYPELPDLAEALDRSVTHYLVDFAQSDAESGEHFITALLADLPDQEPVVRLTNCGHPPPLLLHDGRAVLLDTGRAGPPLGMHELTAGGYPYETFSFEPGDTLLLYTDGVIEARDRSSAFYPLAERAPRWSAFGLEALVEHLRRDLLHHAGGRLGDDAAVIAVRRTPFYAEHRLLHLAHH
jgi:serine phosphatase RsbU (regulator of sigma subunit)